MSGKQPIKTVVAEWESELGVMLSRNRVVNTEWQSRPWLPGSDMVLVGLAHSPRGQRRRLTVSGHWSRILGYVQERNQPPLDSGFFRFHCFESIPDIFLVFFYIFNFRLRLLPNCFSHTLLLFSFSPALSLLYFASFCLKG